MPPTLDPPERPLCAGVLSARFFTAMARRAAHCSPLRPGIASARREEANRRWAMRYGRAARAPVRTRLSYLRYRLYAPVPVWFLLIFCALAFLSWPFSFIGFLVLLALYLWVRWGAPY